MHRSTIVNDAADMTSEWLALVLAENAPDGIDDVIISPVGTGQMARSFRADFATADGARQSVVAKIASADEMTRTIGSRAYVKEVGFYRDLAERVGCRTPAVYHVAINADGDAFTLVLEDLAPATAGNQIEGCTLGQATNALDELARLHASTWNDTTVGDLDWNDQSNEIALNDYVGLALEQFRSRFGDRVQPATMEVFAAFADRANHWAESQPEALAAVHGDFRLDNLMFSEGSGRVAVVDWQTVSLTNPGRDLGYFLGNSLTVDQRRAGEDGLIDGYVSKLNSLGVHYSAAQCRQDTRHGMFQGPLVTMLGAFTADRTERGEQMFTLMADRSASQISDHDALALLQPS